MTSYNYGFGQELDAEADDPAEDIDFDEMLERIHKETGLPTVSGSNALVSIDPAE